MVLEHNLIIFCGSSPGAGKSTLSSFLYEQLLLRDTPVKWIYENDILYLNEFQEFIKDVQSGNPELIHSLLDASKNFVDRYRDGTSILITDSIFPCFNWLIATGYYTHEQIVGFGQQLENVLHPLNPLIIYLDVDQELSLNRAVKQRGQKWLDDTIVSMNGYNQGKPLKSLDDVVTYFRMAGDLSLMWLKDWDSEILLLDSTHTDIAELQTIILDKLELDAVELPVQKIAESLHTLIGTYRLHDKVTSDVTEITVELIDGKLKVNAYWPNGCNLVAESAALFRLENTSHRIRFQDFRGSIPQEMTYDNQDRVCLYKRLKQ